MSDNNTQSFFFDRIRSTVNSKKEIAVQGYAIDGFLEGLRPRAAIFANGKPVKALKCRLEAVKLPPIQMRRRKGETISYLGVFFIDFSTVRRVYPSNAKLVLVGEKKKAGSKEIERIMLYKGSLYKALDRMNSFFLSVDIAYYEEGKTYIKGWMAGTQATAIKIEPLKEISEKAAKYIAGDNSDDGIGENVSVQDSIREEKLSRKELKKHINSDSFDAAKYLSAGVDGTSRVGNSKALGIMDYKIEFIPRDDVLIEFPECPDDACLGFEISVDGEYKKLKVTMSEGERSCVREIPMGKNDDEFSRSNVISRYSEKVVRNLQNYGVRETVSKVKIHLSPSYINLNRNYNKWIKKNSPDLDALRKQKKKEKLLEYRPLFSVLVPLYETDEKFLDELIDSIQNQTYSNWEICFSDGSRDSSRLSEIIQKYSKKDRRIKYTAELSGPLGISSNTNQAFSIAKGDFIILGDHDDLFTPNAFYECVKVMNKNLCKNPAYEPSADTSKEYVRKYDTTLDVLYTDEDKTNANAKRRFEPNIKPDFNQELLESCNYITHMFVVRKTLVDEVGLFKDTYNGAQDYDFILRCTEKARNVTHVPKVVYSWRINDTSTAGNPAAKMYAYDAGALALQAHYDRIGSTAKAEIGDHLGYYHTRFEMKGNPFVVVIVIDADDDDKYNRTMQSILDKSDFKNLSFIRIKNNGDKSLAPQLNRGIREFEKGFKKNEEFKSVKSEDIYVLFIEAGVTMMGEDGISNMLSYMSNRPDVGAMGGKVYCTDGTICHAGVVLEKEKVVGWMYIRHSIYDEMYFNYSAYSALRRGVTLMRLDDIRQNGNWSEDYTGEYTMIEYTYRLTRQGKKCIYDANANFQAKTERGYDADEVFERKGLTRKDLRIFRSKYPAVYEKGDLYFTNIVKEEEQKNNRV